MEEEEGLEREVEGIEVRDCGAAVVVLRDGETDLCLDWAWTTEV